MASHGVTHWFCGHYHRNAGGIFSLSKHGLKCNSSHHQHDQDEETKDDHNNHDDNSTVALEEKHLENDDNKEQGTTGDQDDILLKQQQEKNTSLEKTDAISSNNNNDHDDDVPDATLEVVVTTAIGATVTTNPKGSALGISGMGSFLVDSGNSSFRVCNVTETGLSHELYILDQSDPEPRSQDIVSLRAQLNPRLGSTSRSSATPGGLSGISRRASAAAISKVLPLTAPEEKKNTGPISVKTAEIIPSDPSSPTVATASDKVSGEEAEALEDRKDTDSERAVEVVDSLERKD